MSNTRLPAHRKTPQAAPRPSIASPGRGEALSSPKTGQLSARFGHDFSKVRIHHDAEAARSAEALGAAAYTDGSDITFGQGQYAPETAAGDSLLAHELTHVVQQARFGAGDPGTPSDPDDGAEREADALAERALAGENVRVSAAPRAAISRKESAPTGQAGYKSPDPLVLEQAAHDLSYEQFDKTGHRLNRNKQGTPEWDKEEQQHAYAVAMMQNAGYDVESKKMVNGKMEETPTNPAVTGDAGLSMRRFMPKKDKDGHYLSGVSPIVGFRGTEPGIVSTPIDDLNPSGIGRGQFDWNKKLIDSEMAEASKAGKITVTGHSLGGALAQQAAVSHPDEVGGVTTFMSARVGDGVTQQFDQQNAARVQAGDSPIVSEHYRNGADLVPWGGQGLTKGDVTTYPMLDKGGKEMWQLGSTGPAGQDWLAGHLSWPLAATHGPKSVTGDDGKTIANPYIPQAGGPTFGAPRPSTTDQDKAEDTGTAELARRTVGLPVNMAYHGYNWGSQRYGEAKAGIDQTKNDMTQFGLGRLADMGSGLYNAGANGIGWTQDKAGQMLGALQEQGKSALGWGEQKVGEMGGGLYNTGAGMLNYGYDKARQAVGGINQSLTDAQSWGSGKYGEMQTGVSGFVNQASHWDSPSAVYQGLSGGMDTARNWVGGTVSDMAQGAEAKLAGAAHWTKGVVQEGYAGAERNVGAGLNWVKDTGGQMIHGAGESLHNAGGWAERTFQEGATGLQNTAERGLGWLGETKDRVVHGVGDTLDRANQWGQGVGRDIVNGGHQVEQWGQDVGDAYNKWDTKKAIGVADESLKKNFPNAERLLHTGYDTVREGYGLAQDAYGWEQQKKQEAKSGLYNTGRDALNWGMDKGKQVVGGLDTARDDMLHWGGDKARQVVGGARQTLGDVGNWGSGKVGEMEQGLGGFVAESSQWRTPGQALDGVLGGMSRAENWGSGMVHDMAQGAESRLEGAANWTKSTVAEGMTGAKDRVNAGMNWLDETGQEAVTGVRDRLHRGADWAGGVGSDIYHGMDRLINGEPPAPAPSAGSPMTGRMLDAGADYAHKGYDYLDSGYHRLVGMADGSTKRNAALLDKGLHKGQALLNDGMTEGKAYLNKAFPGVAPALSRGYNAASGLYHTVADPITGALGKMMPHPAPKKAAGGGFPTMDYASGLMHKGESYLGDLYHKGESLLGLGHPGGKAGALMGQGGPSLIGGAAGGAAGATTTHTHRPAHHAAPSGPPHPASRPHPSLMDAAGKKLHQLGGTISSGYHGVVNGVSDVVNSGKSYVGGLLHKGASMLGLERGGRAGAHAGHKLPINPGAIGGSAGSLASGLNPRHHQANGSHGALIGGLMSGVLPKATPHGPSAPVHHAAPSHHTAPSGPPHPASGHHPSLINYAEKKLHQFGSSVSSGYHGAVNGVRHVVNGGTTMVNNGLHQMGGYLHKGYDWLTGTH